MLAIVSVAPPLECDQPLMAPPMSRLRLGVPPSFKNAVTPPVRGPLPQVSHVTLAEPYPSPKPIQNPSRRWGYCARAADAVTPSKVAAARMHAAVRIEPSPRDDSSGEGDFHAGCGQRAARRWAVPFRGQRKTECKQRPGGAGAYQWK